MNTLSFVVKRSAILSAYFSWVCLCFQIVNDIPFTFARAAFGSEHFLCICGWSVGCTGLCPKSPQQIAWSIQMSSIYIKQIASEYI